MVIQVRLEKRDESAVAVRTSSQPSVVIMAQLGGNPNSALPTLQGFGRSATPPDCLAAGAWVGTTAEVLAGWLRNGCVGFNVWEQEWATLEVAFSFLDDQHSAVFRERDKLRAMTTNDSGKAYWSDATP